MTKLTWDDSGAHVYEQGLSHGVLYLDDYSGVPWNGLVSVAGKFDSGSSEPLYLNGAKRMDFTTPTDYAATLTVYTYPDEFIEYDGMTSLGGGLYIKNQNSKRFGLCYRTEVGNDVEGLGHGFKLHIVYNLSAVENSNTFSSMGKSVDLMDFGWDIAGIPEPVTGYRSTAEIIIDSREINKYLLEDLLDILYGTDTTPARLPRLEELKDYVTDWVLITITDNGDGSWTATGPAEYFTMLDSETFQINHIEGLYLDADTYTVSTTHV